MVGAVNLGGGRGRGPAPSIAEALRRGLEAAQQEAARAESDRSGPPWWAAAGWARVAAQWPGRSVEPRPNLTVSAVAGRPSLYKLADRRGRLFLGKISSPHINAVFEGGRHLAVVSCFFERTLCVGSAYPHPRPPSSVRSPAPNCNAAC